MALRRVRLAKERLVENKWNILLHSNYMPVDVLGVISSLTCLYDVAKMLC